ncbi:MAG: hypothetical protein MJB14_01210 [Spirochaetes bacterium]|nr:hypothetical protein [Spirochaetota bacterium]
MNSRTLFFLTGSVLLIAFFITINILFGSSFPWSIFPVFGVLWLPISMYSYEKKSAMAMAVLGSFITIVFFITVNLITSSGFLWCIMPIFGVLWWPLSIYCYQKKNPMLMAGLGSILITIFFMSLNYITSPAFAWSIYPIFMTAWWPLSVYCGQNRNFKLLAVLGSILIMALLFATNYMTITKIDWAFYPLIPLLYWPVFMIFENYRQSLGFHLVLGLVTIGYYVLLNIFFSPGFFWSVFVIYEVILLIIGSYFWQKKQTFWFYLCGFILSATILGGIMLLLGINFLWIYELVFLVVSIQFYFYLRMNHKYHTLVIISSVTVLVYLLINNLFRSPQYPWFLYTLWPIIWLWIMMLFQRYAKTIWFALLSAITGIIYYGILNSLLSPVHPWFIYPAFGMIWWPLAVYYVKTKNLLTFTIIGSSALILFFVTTNLVTTPGVLWCVFPIFLVLWWPLSIYYFIYKRKRMLKG